MPRVRIVLDQQALCPVICRVYGLTRRDPENHTENREQKTYDWNQRIRRQGQWKRVW